MAADLAQEFVSAVHSTLGDSYVYGDTGPAAFDCSGLVWWALHKVGINAPRTSEAQWAWTQHISRSQLKPGDLVFMQFPGDNASPGHVETYIGNGQMIGADDPSVGVVVDTLSSVQGSIVGYGRVPGLSGSAAGASSSGGAGNVLGNLIGLSLPVPLLGMFSQGEKLAHGLLWWINPENWARVIAGVFGFFLLAFGIGFLVAAA